jgi:hypothetical protein
MFVKCRSGANENGSQGTERGFCSKPIDSQHNISFYTHLSLFERYRTITAALVFSSLAHFLWQKVSEIDGNCCYLLAREGKARHGKV